MQPPPGRGQPRCGGRRPACLTSSAVFARSSASMRARCSPWKARHRIPLSLLLGVEGDPYLVPLAGDRLAVGLRLAHLQVGLRQAGDRLLPDFLDLLLPLLDEAAELLGPVPLVQGIAVFPSEEGDCRAPSSRKARIAAGLSRHQRAARPASMPGRDWTALPSWKRRRASAISRAHAVTPPGHLARHFRQTASRSAGSPACSRPGSTGEHSTARRRVSSRSSASSGGRPVSSASRIAPRPMTSTAGPGSVGKAPARGRPPTKGRPGSVPCFRGPASP